MLQNHIKRWAKWVKNDEKGCIVSCQEERTVNCSFFRDNTTVNTKLYMFQTDKRNKQPTKYYESSKKKKLEGGQDSVSSQRRKMLFVHPPKSKSYQKTIWKDITWSKIGKT